MLKRLSVLKTSRYLYITTWCALMALSASCMTVKSEQRLRDDMFKLQTRLLELEKGMQKKSAGNAERSENASKGVASVSTSIDSLEREVQQLSGQVDMFSYALEKGEMPGAMASKDSLFSRLSNIEERVAQIEETQKDILTMIEQSKKLDTEKKASKTIELKSTTRIASLAQAREAFEKRRYAYLKRDIPQLKTKMTKQSSKKELSFLYAESLYKLGSLKDAAIEFNNFLDSKPPKEFLARAKMRMGDCYRHLGDRDTAAIYYEELISEFPSSSEAASARERLSNIKKKQDKKRG